jgi:hypothetical protein
MIAPLFLLINTITAAAASQPATQATTQATTQPALATATVELKVRIVYGHNRATALDPKLNDLFGLLKNLAYHAFELKQEDSLHLQVDGDEVSHTGPSGRHIVVTAKSYQKKKRQAQIRIELEIPELKFRTKASVMEGATLVIGGPKFEDGVLLFALTATTITGPPSAPTQH